MTRLRRRKMVLTVAGFLAIYYFSTVFSGCGESTTGGGEQTTENPTVEVVTESVPRPPLLPKASVSSTIPTEVNFFDNKLPSSPTMGRPGFDHFSWQSFIALNWPAKPRERGVPLNPNDSTTFLNAANDEQVVWDTYKEAWELFGQPDTVRPTVWKSYEADESPCGTDASTKSLQMMSKVGTVFDAIDEALSNPLIDQNNKYVYFDVRFNQVQYDFIRGKDDQESSWLYLSKNLIRDNFPVKMPESQGDTLGSIMLKGAWKQLSESEIQSKRFYTTNAKIYDQLADSCRTVTLGLVGLHFAQKTKVFPEWVWSTFEHVDNVPEPGDPPGKSYSFNNGTDTPKSPLGYDYKPDMQAVPTSQRKPVQVTRYNKIPVTPAKSSTTDINNYYQQEIVKGTVWENYQLVFTQWPTTGFDPSTFKYDDQLGASYPETAGGPFPVDSVTNAVIETYMQAMDDAGAVRNSCMSCHYIGASTYDFSWVLKRRAH